MPSYDTNPRNSQGPVREKTRDPREILAEAEKQWIYTEDELKRAPSIVDGLDPEAERTIRHKGTNFITQVGMMLKLPQTTILAATVFFNRFLMRYSLQPKDRSDKRLHHYQVAATALFLATKVEEHCRKIRELVIACCRVAQKNPNLVVDENTKDYWRWRDTILYNEDVLLELLCFDLTIDSPYTILFNLLQYYGVEKQKKLRDSAWSFINDSNMTQACLLFTSRTIACAALYCGAKQTGTAFSDDTQGRPWWEKQRIPLREIRRACTYMAEFYTNAPGGLKAGSESIYVGLRSPLDDDDEAHRTRLSKSQTPMTPVPIERSGSELSIKREREEEPKKINGGLAKPQTNGHHASNPRIPSSAQQDDGRSAKRQKMGDGSEATTLVNGTAQNEPLKETAVETTKIEAKEGVAQEEDAGSEEGEVEE